MGRLLARADALFLVSVQYASSHGSHCCQWGYRLEHAARRRFNAEVKPVGRLDPDAPSPVQAALLTRVSDGAILETFERAAEPVPELA